MQRHTLLDSLFDVRTVDFLPALQPLRYELAKESRHTPSGIMQIQSRPSAVEDGARATRERAPPPACALSKVDHKLKRSIRVA
jgi:hypothetical protein